MNETQRAATRGLAAPPDPIGVIARNFHARILNCSPTGCLIETNCRLEIGTVGSLQFVIGGRELSDDIQVVRCQTIEGAGSLFQVGARFLWTMTPGRDSLRAALGAMAVAAAPLAG